jgi:hypothetical protein
MKDGTVLTGTIKDLDRKKGLIEEIKLDVDGGKRMKLDPEDIAFAYLPPTDASKLNRALENINEVNNWGRQDLDADIINQGYSYFEQMEVRIKKNKTETLLMQLMNPSFSGNVNVYHDPYAGETTSVGIGGFDLTGGLAKSYYIKIGDAVAYRVKKKEYNSECKLIFAGCDAVLADEDMGVWREFARHVYEYSQNCGE